MLLLALALVMICASAWADIACDCLDDPCSCFLQLGDEGCLVKAIHKQLIEQGYLPKKCRSDQFDEAMQRALMTLQADHQLPTTGTLDDATLNCLLWGETTHAMLFDLVVPDTFWIPTDGGQRAHAKPNCSGMVAPRKISLANALALGIEPCGRCAKLYRQLTP